MSGIRSYFEKIDATIPLLKKATTPDEVIAILLTVDAPSSGDAFWGGDGDELSGALYDAGWRDHRYKAAYYWVLKAPKVPANAPDKEMYLSYTEGDVSRGDNPMVDA